MRSIGMGFGVGLLFGGGLILAGMTRPAKVIGFLDLLGGWDPSLAFVMIGAIAVHALAYRLVPRMRGPLWGEGGWALPTRTDVDGRLVVGAALFGAGWGLGGYCPGPALTAVSTGAIPTLLFTGSMLAGMALFAAWDGRASAVSVPAGTPLAGRR